MRIARIEEFQCVVRHRGPMLASPPMAIRAVGVCLRAGGSSRASEALRHLNDWLEKQRVEALYDRYASDSCGQPSVVPAEMAARADLIVALGGDGTLLRVARELGTQRIPILGINLGTLGYLTEFSVDEMIPALDRVLSGAFEIQERLRMDVRVEREGGEQSTPTPALNDVVVATRASRMITLEVRADDAPVTTYHADGLIVSTPTGSTAYSLSAGGPIVLPGTAALLLTPICPHTLSQRPLVVPSQTQICLSVPAPESGVTLTVDGQEMRDIRQGDRVCIGLSPHSVDLITSPYHSRFDVLRSKLGWGQR